MHLLGTAQESEEGGSNQILISSETSSETSTQTVPPGLPRSQAGFLGDSVGGYGSTLVTPLVWEGATVGVIDL